MVSKRIIHAQPNPNSTDTQTVVAEPESRAQYLHIYTLPSHVIGVPVHLHATVDLRLGQQPAR